MGQKGQRSDTHTLTHEAQTLTRDVVTAPFRFVQPQPVSMAAEMTRLINKDAKAFISFPPEILVAELLFPLLSGLAW